MADFLTVNIGSIINKNKQIKNTENNAEDEIAATSELKTAKKDLTKITDWARELQDRREANAKLGEDARLSEVDVKHDFFRDFFTARWGEELAEKLMSFGNPLMKAFEILGYENQPIYNFLIQPYVKKYLIQTDLLNAHTFKGIYNAVAKKLVKDDEFNSTKDYNIIYCRDLYRKSANTIEEYLELQKEILEGTIRGENGETKPIINRKIFLSVAELDDPDLEVRANQHKKLSEKQIPRMLDNNARLNSLELAKKIKSSLIKGKAANVGIASMSQQDQKALITAADSIPKIFATLQYLNVTADSAEARKALSHAKLAKLSAQELVKASLAIKKHLPVGRLDSKKAKTLVDTLVAKLDEM